MEHFNEFIDSEVLISSRLVLAGFCFSVLDLQVQDLTLPIDNPSFLALNYTL